MISRIDSADPVAFDAWYAAVRAASLADRDPGVVPLPHPDSLRAVLRGRGGERRALACAAHGEDGGVAGALLLELGDRDNLHLAEVDVNVPVRTRRRGHGTRLWEHAERVMAEEGRTTALAEVQLPSGRSFGNWPGARFALALGFGVVHEEDYYVLGLPLAARTREDVGADVLALGSRYELLTWTDACPEELLEDYARLRTRMEADVPLGETAFERGLWDPARVRAQEERRRAQRYRTLVCAARAATGGLAGYSEIALPEGEGAAYQEDTLVAPEHRGNRLGSALKLRNLEVLAAEFPERVQVRTWNAPGNAPMRRVNLRLGFRPVERMHEFQRVLPGAGG
ncbi:GNAT family N-acetyltransferase [Nocardiopsis sp. HUAS JQ3]|uniref:GNAT family N-acetyltransferase n=1 Tax=Nocardiopsis sp. HUAS JQ3 TaxID=3061629 RepID=UPI0023A97BB5|nr:GNAT family N-acetyltransferase [Nocardiopsis sp. HUAS JQ3]WDZ89966.1 N-acetyltransferase [Nocardiopsis sp. HUAS JQ3]